MTILWPEKSSKVVLLLLIGILIALLGWLLFSPLILQVNTVQNEYKLRWWGLGSASVVPVKDDLLLRLHLPFWYKDFSLIKLLFVKSTQNKPTRTREAVGKRKSKWRFTWTRFCRILRSFRVLYFRMELDTDDYVTNAFLYPVCSYWNTPTKYVAVNFQGRNQCAFRIQNRLWSVLMALIF